MRPLILLILLGIMPATAFSKDLRLGKGWVLVDAPVVYRPDMAQLCSGTFLLNISQPKEEISCGGLMENLFLADLAVRKVFWSRQSLASVISPHERRANLDTVYDQLVSGGLETLENMRDFYLGDVEQPSSAKSVGNGGGHCSGEQDCGAINKPRISPYIQYR